MSPSIAVRDAMSKLYTITELAERSLEGATPVKAGSDGQRLKKKKMTPQKREALLGMLLTYTYRTQLCKFSSVLFSYF